MAWFSFLTAAPLNLPKSDGLAEWYQQLQQQANDANLFNFALIAGCNAPNFAHAFFAGYQVALKALVPEAPAGIGAFCLTEETGNRPKELQTTWNNTQLNGHKNFITGGELAQWLVVIAKQADHPASQRPTIKALLVERQHNDLSQLQVTNKPPLSILSELPHGEASFVNASATLLNGDGWNDYSKLFRILEDAYVLTATMGWLYQQALENNWPKTLIISFLGIIASLSEALADNPQSPTMHLVLESAFMQFNDLSFELSTTMLKTESPYLKEWQQDRAVFNIGKQARQVRFKQALDQLNIVNG